MMQGQQPVLNLNLYVLRSTHIYTVIRVLPQVPHRQLLYKLNYYRIRGSTHKWIVSWLSERYQKVLLDGQASDPVPVLYYVTQGSVLGLVMFLIFIHDLPDNIRSSDHLFATCSSLTDCQILQIDIKSLANESLIGEWNLTHQMLFNEKRSFIKK